MWRKWESDNPFISARNNQNPDEICRGFVFRRIPATFLPQGYQYVQRSYQIIEYPHHLHTTAKTGMSKKEKAAYNPALGSKL
ncbi:MAG: hypothetical protein Q4C08_02705 [Pseudomonadota bacterium]|nr:hypothetical protein [Pseudomonadota bacterium]